MGEPAEGGSVVKRWAFDAGRGEMFEIASGAFVRVEVVEALCCILWMAREYAEAGGSGGPEMRDFREACEEAGINPEKV